MRISNIWGRLRMVILVRLWFKILAVVCIRGAGVEIDLILTKILEMGCRHRLLHPTATYTDSGDNTHHQCSMKTYHEVSSQRM